MEKINKEGLTYLSNKKTKDPVRYPKVQNGYEDLSKVIFSTQMNSLLRDLTKEMVKIKAR